MIERMGKVWLCSAVLAWVPWAVQAQVAAAAGAGVVAAAPHLVAAVPAVLTSAVTSGSAHVGQAVLAKVSNPSALSNGLKLPAGSQLLGHVTQVQTLSGGKGVSQLGMLFDKVKLPGGQEQPMAASVLRSVGSAQAPGPAGSGQQSSAQAGAAPGNTGLLSGVVGAVGTTVNGVVSTTGQLLGAVTGLTGVLLSSTGTLAAQNKDVSVPAGTQVSIGVAADVSAAR